jgi:hypothetical protein
MKLPFPAIHGGISFVERVERPENSFRAGVSHVLSILSPHRSDAGNAGRRG